VNRIIQILAVLLLGSSTLSAQIALERSRLLASSTASNQAQTESTQGFSEVKDSPIGSAGFKKPWKAFLMSFVIPGAGEHYVGSQIKSRVFLLSEIGFWSALVSFRHLGKWREDDFKMQAVRAAGADVNGKDDRYFDVLGFYGSREDYNKVGRVYDPERPYYSDTKAYFWRWESDAARQKYRSLKNDSRSYYRDANFALGLIVANHLLSAMDAYWSAKRFNRGKEAGFSGVDLRLLPDRGWQVSIGARF
jgi:hypothetical protein